EIDNKTYFVFWNKQNMENFNNTKIGTLIYAFEVTKLKDEFHHNIILSILQPIMGMIIFILILNWLFNYIVKQNRIYRKEIDKIITKNRQKDQQMMHQSRLAQMGEMISMIAHQWRQPLTAISATSANINLKTKLDKLDANTALELSDRISRYSQHLSTTIDDFRDFFKHNKEKKDTNYTEVIKGVLNIIETSIINQNITLIQNLTSTDTLHTYPNELKQVILNLIKNAEDVLVESNIPNPTITIETKDKILTISDNAGGVPEDIIDKIFDPYFSTKTKKNGTGLGLYMSKTIIEEHCNGKLYVSNNNIVNQDGSTSYGAVFNINLEKANDD
ncbi:MAG: sensor histidine kinase, partial [Epsilonproteobacteria bacterium]